jgi:hypothetical protein
MNPMGLHGLEQGYLYFLLYFTSHVTQMLRNKTERVETRRGKIQFYWIPGHCGVEVNVRAHSEAKHSIKDGRDSQLSLPVVYLKAQWKNKSKEELHSFCENTKRDRGENYFERYYRNDSSPWLSELKMNRWGFVSKKSYKSRPLQS